MASEEIIDTVNVERPLVSVLLPVHNEADLIADVVAEIHEKILSKIDGEIVISEDGSTDGTKDVVKQLSREIPLRAILSDERKGYAYGIIDGLKHVRAPYVLFMDSDGQYNPDDFWKLWEYKDKYDIVVGRRVKRNDNWFRKLMSATFQSMSKIAFWLWYVKDITSPFRLAKTTVARDVASEFKYMVESFWTEFTIKAHLKGYKTIEIPIEHRPRPTGDTRVYKPSKIPGIAFRQAKALVKIRFEAWRRRSG
ncbi:MAG: glycosyltransferase family 2 protein [Desulfurococcales archaeon]|nr:glycosyltransferase family 2 protein [Desulfurococcales archaeon]